MLTGGSRPMVRRTERRDACGRRAARRWRSWASPAAASRPWRARLVRLIEADQGEIRFAGEDVRAFRGEALRRYNRRVQMVFQDPYGSLNPRMTVGEMLGEALRVHDLVPPERRDCPYRRTAGPRAAARQRIADACRTSSPAGSASASRSPVPCRWNPICLIADEIVSALDVSVQAQILNLLLDLQERLGLAILFVSHDLRVVRHIAHRVAVMYLGRVVELGPSRGAVRSPRHPYTQALLRAAPTMEPPPDGVRPSPVSGACGELRARWQYRPAARSIRAAPAARAECVRDMPRIHMTDDGHLATCHLLH